MLHDTHTFSGADASTTRSPDLREMIKEETPNLYETISDSMLNQDAARAVLLNIFASDEPAPFPSQDLSTSTKAIGGAVTIPVQIKKGELLGVTLKQIAGEDSAPADTLVVCQLGSGVIETTGYGLGTFLRSYVGDKGCLVCVDDASCRAKRDLLFELAGVGLIPGGDTSQNSFSGGFTVYFEKVAFSIRSAGPEDVADLFATDEDSWEGPLAYTLAHLESRVLNAADILVTEGSDGKLVGAMYTQRIQNGELVDYLPWRQSILVSCGLVSKPKADNINKKGMVKQLMRVSTKQGGEHVDKFVPGTSLREFALYVAAAEGIDEVVSLLMLSLQTL